MTKKEFIEKWGASMGHGYTDEELSADLDSLFPPPAEGAEEIAQRCPVCGGNGLVPNGFYLQTSGSWSTASITPETCRSCNGTGVVFATLHAQRLAEKMVEERMKNAPKNCPKAAQCAHVEGGMKCPPNVICPI